METAECEEVQNSIFLVQRYENHKNQMKGCAVELKVNDWQKNAWTLWACNTVQARRGMPDNRCNVNNARKYRIKVENYFVTNTN